MNYREAYEWLHGLQGMGIKLGLEQIEKLTHVLGVQTVSSEKSRFIHVAGTNGKGSVCAMMAAICQEAGFRTGLFTSPHLVSFRERIQLNGTLIPEDDVAEGIGQIQKATEAWDQPSTYFEVCTALALWWFEQKGAEVIVLETGMGGRLDSTNVVTPSVSVITQIGLDHTKYLGETIELIAGEKAGIIKPGVPVVSSGQKPSVEAVFSEKAHATASLIRFVKEPVAADWKLSLAGSHQRWNAALALEALRILQIPALELNARVALEKVVWPGRFQRLGDRIILDGAHNPQAAARLVQTWREEFGAEFYTLVLGVLGDKDVEGVCKALAPLAKRCIVVPVRSYRALTPGALAGIVRRVAPGLECEIADSLSGALDLAQGYKERVLITGSLFLVGEALSYLNVAGGQPDASE